MLAVATRPVVDLPDGQALDDPSAIRCVHCWHRQSSATTTNSSPPSRATVSSLPSPRCRYWPPSAAHRTATQRVVDVLNRSRSMNSTATLVRCGGTLHRMLQLRIQQQAIGQTVRNASWCAICQSLRSESFVSVMSANTETCWQGVPSGPRTAQPTATAGRRHHSSPVIPDFTQPFAALCQRTIKAPVEIGAWMA